MSIDPTIWLLALARALPFAWLMPLAGRDIPRAVSLAVVLAIASVMGAFSPTLHVAPAGSALLLCIACELAVGAVLALACAMPFIALQWTGQLAQTVVLLQRAPAEAGPLATLFRLAALNVFFMLGGQRALCTVLVSSLEDVPLGVASLRPEPLALAIAQLCVDALALSLALALPLLITLWMLDVGLGLAARATHTSSVTVAHSALRVACALGVLALTFTPMLDAFPLALRTALATARSLLRAIAG